MFVYTWDMCDDPASSNLRYIFYETHVHMVGFYKLSVYLLDKLNTLRDLVRAQNIFDLVLVLLFYMDDQSELCDHIESSFIVNLYFCMLITEQ